MITTLAWVVLLTGDVAPESQPASNFAAGFLDEDAPASQATQASEPASATPTAGPTPVEPPSRFAWYRGIELNGFLEAGFIALFPAGTNGFFVGEAELDLERRFFDVARLRVDGNLVQRRPWDPTPGLSFMGGPTSLVLTLDSLVEQAFVEFFPLGDQGPKLRLGKYNALVAHERVDPTDRALISQSLVFIHGSPVNFTGLALELPELYGFRLTAHAAFNGWDQGVATRINKSVGGKLAYRHAFAAPWIVSASFAALYGTERFASTRDARLTFFGELSVEYNHQLSLAAEATYGREAGLGRTADNRVPGNLTAQWFGVSVFADWSFLSWLSAGLRYDYFDDKDRSRTLLQSGGSLATGFTRRQQLTIGARLRPFEGGTIRLEYTADFASGNEPHSVVALSTVHRLGLTAVLAF